MMKKNLVIRALLSLLLMVLVPCFCLGEEEKQITPLQPAHRVDMTFYRETQPNGSVLTMWHAETALQNVTDEINGLAETMAAELLPLLPAAEDTDRNSSRLSIGIRYSRTGLRWLSFLIQGRTVFHLRTTGNTVVSRTYDMETGERIRLGDVFSEQSDFWSLLRQRVDATVRNYFPGEDPARDALDRVLQPERLCELDFTLHGMSLVIHLRARDFYPDRTTMIEIPFYYPEIRPMMTAEAAEQTDNLRWYRTCALSLDDGPFGYTTDLALEGLMASGVRATFFLVGSRLEKGIWQVEREHDEGHAIGAHGWEHVNGKACSKDELRALPDRYDAVLERIIGIPVRYARAPGGIEEPYLEAGVRWPLIHWSVNASDSSGVRSSQEIAKQVRGGIVDGGIILCHDIHDKTGRAIRDMIRMLEEKGYMLLTVDELFAKDGVELEPARVYWRCHEGRITRYDEE